MLDSIKIKIKYFIMKAEWKKKNKNNYTYPSNLCDIKIIEIGDYTYGAIDAESYGCSNSFLKIGRYCSIAKNVRFILDGEHNYKTMSTYPFRVRFLGEKNEALCKGPIIIGDDVWIGERSIILSGVTIGQGAIIGAGSVVRKSIPPYAIYANNEIIKYRFDKNVIDLLMQLDYGKISKENYCSIRELAQKNIDEEVAREILTAVEGL